MAELDPERILRVLADRGVAYVMIGGLAAAIHGSDVATTDLDITPAAREDNLARLSSALDDLHARVRTPEVPEGLPFAHDARSLARARIWNLTTDAGDLDISFVPSGTQGYDDLARHAITLDIDGVRTYVASLADIIRSKEAAGRPKDLAVLPLLELLQREIESDS